jgi:hypothetical protein
LAFATSASLLAMIAILLTSVAPATASEGCSNEARREEQGAAGRALPDCRAYELVTPPYTPSPGYYPYFQGLPPVIHGFGFNALGTEFNEQPVLLPPQQGGTSARDGNTVAFGSREPNSQGKNLNSNLSRRGPNGWTGENIEPPQSKSGFFCGITGYENFSANLEQVVFRDGQTELESGQITKGTEVCGHDEPRLVPGEPEGSSNLFLRDTATGAFRLVNVTPPGTPPHDPWFDAISADGSHVVFQSRAKLTPNAQPEEGGNVCGPPTAEGPAETNEFGDIYVWSAGAVHLLTVLPFGQAARGTLAGSINGACNYPSGQGANITHAISANGERILFYSGGGFKHPSEEHSNPRVDNPYIGGGLYMREHPGADQSGECTEPAKACTVQVDAPQGVTATAGKGLRFQWASADASKIFFTEEEKLTPDSKAQAGKPDLYEYDLEKSQGQRLTDLTANASEPADVRGVSGASEDGSYLYFVAQAVLSGAQQNSHGEVALGPAQGTGALSGVVTATGTIHPIEGQRHGEITELSVSSGEFREGQEVSGEGIEPYTTITHCSPNCSAPTALTLNSEVAFSYPGEEITGLTSKEVTGLNTTSGAFHEGMAISGPGVDPHTWVTAVGPGTLTLSGGSSVNGPRALSATAANLYLRHAGATTFIATLNAVGGDQCDWTQACLTSRVSSSGAFIAFDSFDSLTGYDNNPVQPHACGLFTGGLEEAGGVKFAKGEKQPCLEAFRYAAVAGAHGELTCAGCNPTGAPPASEFAYSAIEAPERNAGTAGTSMTMSQNVTDSGEVFFSTMEKLVPTDENKTWDVYEYSGGEGPSAQLHLISSGKSEQPSYFAGVTPNGSDVFFLTGQSLLRADTRTDYDLYDARVGGGFAEPLIPQCEGEGCRSAYPGALGSASPGSAAFEGKGNVHPAGTGNPHPAKCKKGFVKKKGKCVKQRKKKSKKAKKKKSKKSKKSIRRAAK